jgi:O-antigen/teichoic acid export membrane protein
MLRRALAINTVATIVNMVSQLASVALISRLLRPEEIGLFSVASAFAALLVAARDLGIGLYILQERDLHPQKLNTALTILAISSLLFGALLFFSSWAIASYYEEPALVGLVQLISANFLFVVWIGGMNARLQRELAYGLVAKCSIASTLAGAISGVAFAAYGMGPSSLAYALLVTSTTQVMALAAYRPRQLFWRPTLTAAKEVLSFGWRVLLGSVSQQGAAVAPDLIIGKSLGMEPVAMFNRAMALRGLVATHLVQIIQSTMIPKFAAEHRESSLTAETYIYRNRLVTGLLVPVYLVSAALAEPLILILFGPQWQPAVVVAQVLCTIPVVAVPYSLLKTAAAASGQVGALARLEVSCLVARVLAIAIGAQFGLLVIAALMVVEVLIYAGILSQIGGKLIGLGAWQLYRSCAGDYVTALLAAAAAWSAAQAVSSIGLSPTMTSLLALLAGALAATSAWLLLLGSLNKPLAAEMALAKARALAWLSSRWA